MTPLIKTLGLFEKNEDFGPLRKGINNTLGKPGEGTPR